MIRAGKLLNRYAVWIQVWNNPNQQFGNLPGSGKEIEVTQFVGDFPNGNQPGHARPGRVVNWLLHPHTGGEKQKDEKDFFHVLLINSGFSKMLPIISVCTDQSFGVSVAISYISFILNEPSSNTIIFFTVLPSVTVWQTISPS